MNQTNDICARRASLRTITLAYALILSALSLNTAVSSQTPAHEELITVHVRTSKECRQPGLRYVSLLEEPLPGPDEPSNVAPAGGVTVQLGTHTVTTGPTGEAMFLIPRGSYTVTNSWPFELRSVTLMGVYRDESSKGASQITSFDPRGISPITIDFPARREGGDARQVFDEFELSFQMIDGSPNCNKSREKTKWVRTSPEGGQILKQDPRVLLSANRMIFNDYDTAGNVVSNTVTWETPPAEMFEGEEFKLRLWVTKHPGAAITAFWGSFDPSQRNTLWGVNSYGQDNQHNESRFTFRNMGRDYNNSYIDLKDGITDNPQYFHLRWNYERRPPPPPPTPTPTPVPVKTATVRLVKAPEKATVSMRRGLRYVGQLGIGDELQEKDELTFEEGSGAVVELPGGILFSIRGPAQVVVGTLFNEESRRKVELLLKSGEIRTQSPPKEDAGGSAGAGGLQIKTPTANVTSTRTFYSVIYDAQAQVTRVSVEEGEVAVVPENSSLKPVLLAAQQRAEVTRDRIDSNGTPMPDTTSGGGSKAFWILLGLGALIVLAAVLFLFWRGGGGRPRASSPSSSSSSSSSSTIDF